MDFFSLQQEFEDLFWQIRSSDLLAAEADWEPTEDEPTAYIKVTIGFSVADDGNLSWCHQTGCNESSGGAYPYSRWYTTEIAEQSDCGEEAFSAVKEIYSTLRHYGHEVGELGLLWSLESNSYAMRVKEASANRWSSNETVIKTYDPYEGSEETLISFFLSDNSQIIDLGDDEFALIAKIVEAPGASPRITYYSMGNFPDNYQAVKWAADYAFFAYQRFERDRHLAACPSSERIDWVDDKFNPIPQTNLPDPDIGGVW
jgi:hypothetical protein